MNGQTSVKNTNETLKIGYAFAHPVIASMTDIQQKRGKQGDNYMRDIRFRAWTEIEHEWLGMKYDVPHNYNDSVMQFTGLTDKNGKEIYEGDIVEQEYWNGEAWETATAAVEWNISYCAFRLANILRTELAGPNCEVIGDIYSTPELLTNK